MCEADQGRRKVHELVTALADKTKGCTAIRAELKHMRLELSPWTKVGGSTPVRSGAATGSKMIHGCENIDARIADLEGHIAEFQQQLFDKSEAIDALQDTLDQTQASCAEADGRVSDLCV